MRKLFRLTCFFLFLTAQVYSGPRHIVSRSFVPARASVHPEQIIIFASADADAGDAYLNSQGQQRAAYLQDFLLYQNPNSFTINQAANRIQAFYVPKDDMGNFYAAHALQTIAPLYHQANGIRIEQKKTENLPYNQEYTLAAGPKDSPQLMSDLLLSGGGQIAAGSLGDISGKTFVICWRLEQITTNSDGLFGDPSVQQYLTNALSNFEGLGSEQNYVWIIEWLQDTPVGKTLKEVNLGDFNEQ